MSNTHEVLQYTGGVFPDSNTWPCLAVRLFSDRMKAAWMIIASLACIAELIPIGPMPFWLFELCYLAKVSLFFGLGFVAPLSFYRLNGIGLSLAFSFSSTPLIEVFQGIVKNGHSFHWSELVGKLALIAIGFAIALNCRYELRISMGAFDIRLETGHLISLTPQGVGK